MLQQFYNVFPSEIKNELYITGESYAGHYVPAIGAFIHEENKKMDAKDGEVMSASSSASASLLNEIKLTIENNDYSSLTKTSEFKDVRINLAGVAIGDGWIDPVNMIPAYPNLMFNLGLADAKQKAVIQGAWARVRARVCGRVSV